VKHAILALLAGGVAALLSSCVERREGPVQPPPIAHAYAPDTSVLGAAPAPGSEAGAVLANCGFRRLPEEVLQRINAVRASGYRCGGRHMGPAAPVHWNGSLYSAAASHSLDMAKRNYFEHRSPDGSDVGSRATDSSYHWRALGENIAGGDRSVAQAMQSWLDSAEHCENMLDPRFSDIAVACVAEPRTHYGTYWTMVLGRKWK
jgi:uncharacterized protein YkwD